MGLKQPLPPPELLFLGESRVDENGFLEVDGLLAAGSKIGHLSSNERGIFLERDNILLYRHLNYEVQCILTRHWAEPMIISDRYVNCVGTHHCLCQIEIVKLEAMRTVIIIRNGFISSLLQADVGLVLVGVLDLRQLKFSRIIVITHIELHWAELGPRSVGKYRRLVVVDCLIRRYGNVYC